MIKEVDLAPADRFRPVSLPVLCALAGASAVGLVVILGDPPSNSSLLIGAGVIAAPVAITGIVYALRHREWLPFALALIFLLIEISFLSDSTRAPLHYGALAMLALPLLPAVGRSGILKTAGFRLYFIYFAWAAVTVVYSLSPLYSGARLIESLLAMVALAACALEVRQPEDVSRLLLHFLLAGGVILVLLAVSAVLMPHSVAWATPDENYTARELVSYAKSGLLVEGLNRFRGMLNNPNDVGGLMLIVVGPTLVRWPLAQGRERLLLATMIIASLAFDFMADSRSPLVAIGIGCALYTIWKWGFRGFLLYAGVLVLAAAVASFYSGLSAYVARGDVSTLTGRTDMWKFVIQQIKERPFFGYGYETGGTVFDSRYFPLWWGPWDLGPHSSIHNGYLGHALGVGIPATILWLFIALRPWVFVLRQPKDPWNLKPMIFFIVIPILVNNLSEQVLGDFGGGITALLFGLTWVIAERSRALALEKARVERERAHAELPCAVAALVSAKWAQASRF